MFNLEKKFLYGLTIATLILPSISRNADAQIVYQTQFPRPQASFFVSDRLDFSSRNTTCHLGVCNDKWQHLLGQAAIGTSLILPILPRKMRDEPWERIAIGTGISILWEVKQTIQTAHNKKDPLGYGFSYNDVLVGVAGQLVVEGINYAVRKIF